MNNISYSRKRRVKRRKNLIKTIKVTISSNTGSTYNGVADCWIRETSPTVNFNDTTIVIAAWVAGDRKHALLKFTGLSNAVAAGKTVTNAKVRMYATASPGNTPTIELYALATPFVEAQATWNVKATASLWVAAGALNAPSDYVDSQLSSVAITTAGSYYELSGSLVNSYVQSIINGGVDNGLVLFDSARNAPNSRESTFHSSTGTDGLRPELVFDITL